MHARQRVHVCSQTLLDPLNVLVHAWLTNRCWLLYTLAASTWLEEKHIICFNVVISLRINILSSSNRCCSSIKQQKQQQQQHNISSSLFHFNTFHSSHKGLSKVFYFLSFFFPPGKLFSLFYCSYSCREYFHLRASPLKTRNMKGFLMFSDCVISDYQKPNASWKAVCFGWTTGWGHGFSNLTVAWKPNVCLRGSLLFNLIID